jgi:predicted DNA-binding transcriptional regulator AlpA
VKPISNKRSAQVTEVAKLNAASGAVTRSPALVAAKAAGIADAAPTVEAADSRHDQCNVHGVRAPTPLRLLGKSEVIAITGVSFPTLWTWMRAGTFPRSRAVGGQSKWRSDEIDEWLANLPVRALKGDADVEVA